MKTTTSKILAGILAIAALVTVSGCGDSSHESNVFIGGGARIHGWGYGPGPHWGHGRGFRFFHSGRR